jgi:cytochrome c-type biogenesis protein CcmH
MIGALLLALAFAAIMMPLPAHAVRPDEMLADPGLEARAREVGRELRCLVCRNQSIDDSDADLAHDLRVLVRERIEAGDSNDQIVAYVRARYGDFVLLRPPFDVATVLLWGGPLLILMLGGAVIARFYRGREAVASAPLSAEERRRLAAVLGEGTDR